MGAWWPPRSSTPAWSSNSTRRVRFPSASAISSLKLKGTDKMAGHMSVSFSPTTGAAGFDVPLDGVSWNGGMYVFFSADRRQAGIYALLGRSILARSDNNGLDFTLLYEVSWYKFVNVSTMIVDAAAHGLPGTGPQLVIFGSGRYRSSDVYLAVKPAVAIAQPGGFLFYSQCPHGIPTR
jgi:hypothetical protein